MVWSGLLWAGRSTLLFLLAPLCVACSRYRLATFKWTGSGAERVARMCCESGGTVAQASGTVLPRRLAAAWGVAGVLTPFVGVRAPM